MTDTRAEMKARAAALFREPAKQAPADAMSDSKARVEREREKMARLRVARLARKGK
jgi:hypothetical protein